MSLPPQSASSPNTNTLLLWLARVKLRPRDFFQRRREPWQSRPQLGPESRGPTCPGVGFPRTLNGLLVQARLTFPAMRRHHAQRHLNLVDYLATTTRPRHLEPSKFVRRASTQSIPLRFPEPALPISISRAPQPLPRLRDLGLDSRRHITLQREPQVGFHHSRFRFSSQAANVKTLRPSRAAYTRGAVSVCLSPPIHEPLPR